jgi:raffinose/stachyose/melibiose transport system permease protein
MNTKKDFNELLVSVIKVAFLLSVLMFYFFPIAWMYLSSMRSNGEILKNPLGFPTKISFVNYIEAFQMADLFSHFLISVIITAVSVFTIVMLATLAGYAFSRLDFKGKKIFYSLFALGLILPVQGFLVGMFILFKVTNLLNTIWSVILPVSAVGLPLAVFLIKNFYDTLPTSLEESAYIDGASALRIFWSIVLPLTKPITATVIIFSAVGAWNEFLIPFVMIQESSIKPLTTSLYVFSTKHSANFALKQAALAMIATPMFLIYFLFQGQIQRGLTAGAVKG